LDALLAVIDSIEQHCHHKLLGTSRTAKDGAKAAAHGVDAAAAVKAGSVPDASSGVETSSGAAATTASAGATGTETDATQGLLTVGMSI